jgi:hypothetical protein
MMNGTLSVDERNRIRFDLLPSLEFPIINQTLKKSPNFPRIAVRVTRHEFFATSHFRFFQSLGRLPFDHIKRLQ